MLGIGGGPFALPGAGGRHARRSEKLVLVPYLVFCLERLRLAPMAEVPRGRLSAPVPGALVWPRAAEADPEPVG